MQNKDKRSLALSFILGDGCLHYIRNGKRLYGGITIAHSTTQADYLSWKASLLGDVFNKKVKVRPFKRSGGYDGSADALQVSVCVKRMRAWRKFCYPGNKKSMARVLRFIRHPELAVAIWLMDDGYVEPSIQKGVLYSAAFRLFCSDQSPEEHEEIIKWFQRMFMITPKVFFQKKEDKLYPYLRISAKDSMRIWEGVRHWVMQFDSMQHKFRYMEKRFLFKVSQPAPGVIAG